jgi:hypothetical protein
LEGISHTTGRCVENFCPGEPDLDVQWLHKWGDCVETLDDFEDEINLAAEAAIAILDPAVRMVDVMESQSPEYREYLWNYGFGGPLIDSDPSLGGGGDPSMRGWFGTFDEDGFFVIANAIRTALARITTDPVRFACHIAGNAHCAGAPQYHNPGSHTIHLCREWRDEEDQRVWRLIHELLHFAFPGHLVNVPRDVKHSLCIAGTSTKCYRDDAMTLAHLPWITKDVLDVVHWSNKPFRASFINVDNINNWVHVRAAEWGTCTFPPGAARP